MKLIGLDDEIVVNLIDNRRLIKVGRKRKICVIIRGRSM